MKRILVIGAGSIGRRHLTTAEDLFPNCELAVLRRTESLSANPQDCTIFHTIEEALNFAPDLVIVCSPASLHLKQARIFVEAGINLLIEKPLSIDTNEVNDLLQSGFERGVLIQTAYNLRFLDSLIYFKNLCQSGKYGRLVSIESAVGQYLPDWRPNQDYRQGVTAQKKFGGGVLLELSHEIDYIMWIFGEIMWVRATLAQKSNLEIDVEDSAHITFGVLENISAREVIGTLNMDMVRRDPVRRCTVNFENGTLEWNGIKNQVSAYIPENEAWEKIYSGRNTIGDTYAVQLLSVAEKVSQLSPDLGIQKNGFQVMKVVEAVRKSSSAGTQIPVFSYEVTVNTGG